MDKEKLVEVAIKAIDGMADILNIFVDTEHYPEKENVYDALMDYLLEKGYLEKCS